ncbi:MAG TPA: hypothetical protein DCE58_01980 [Cryomorphaceae bacterium]|nr:hypothetical protein [Cryomorphaceae bacterium]
MESWTLANAHGYSATILSYGAVLQSLIVPHPKGPRDVVLGFDDPEDYVRSMGHTYPPFYGAVVGRHSGRIARAHLPMGDQIHHLEANDGPNHLHGGQASLSRKFWRLVDQSGGPEPYLTLEVTSPDGEGGYPGDLTARVTYQLTENGLRVELTAKCDQESLVNLTQHSCFNLNGGETSTENHRMQVNATASLETNQMIPTGNLLPLKTDEFDSSLRSGLDRTYVLAPNEPAATLEVDDLRMTAHTNQAALHVFVGGGNETQMPGKGAQPYMDAWGICLENQGFPDAPHHPHFPTTFLAAGETYVNWITFDFEML